MIQPKIFDENLKRKSFVIDDDFYKLFLVMAKEKKTKRSMALAIGIYLYLLSSDKEKDSIKRHIKYNGFVFPITEGDHDKRD